MAPAATTPANTNGYHKPRTSRLFSLKDKPSLQAFTALTSQTTSASDYPLAASIECKIPVYDLSTFDPAEESSTSQLQDEWNHNLLAGPGVFVAKSFFDDLAPVDTANAVYDTIIKSEAATSKGDHFASAGSNSRIWNSYQKHAEAHPLSFVQYYSNPWLVHVAESWLGPAYQITAQVNQVHPGGKPQFAHRDYHLGFQTAEASASYPKAMHVASSLLTLQGGVAHSDMPLESGPTRFLPFSQMFEEGFMAYRLPEFSDYFNSHHVSVPLAKGDAVFFNPSLFHAAGENRTTDFERSANLLQISSAFGKTMESINTQAIIKVCWPEVVKLHQSEGLSQRVEAAIKAIGDGYPFPTNLDKRPPASGGMAPESEQQMLRRSLTEGWSPDEAIKEAAQIRLDSLP